MPTALIIGAGAGIGRSTADAFADAGYTVAISSRSNKGGSKHKHFALDVSKPESIPSFFAEVRKTVGIPSVVIYNAYVDIHETAEEPFAVSTADFSYGTNVNLVSMYAAAAESAKGFEELQSKGELGSEGATFIMTGNALNDTAVETFMGFSAQKAGAAVLIKHLALISYRNKPFKWYWGDQRQPDGSAMYAGPDGPAHAEEYLRLAKGPEQGPWQNTFNKGKGYKEFPTVDAILPN